MVLLVGAGLMVRTLVRMQSVPLTFDPARILTMRVPLAETRYPTPEERGRFLQTLVDRVEPLPGVKAVAVDSGLPFVGARGTRVTIPGRPPTDQGSLVHETTASYLAVLRARLVAGRMLEKADVIATRHVGVVNRAFAQRFFGNDSPLGQSVRLDYLAMPPVRATDNAFEIVGIVDDIRNMGVRRDTWPEIYVPFGVNGNFANLIVEGNVPPLQLERSVRAQVYGLDAEQPVTDVRTLDALIDEVVFARPRFSLILLGVFSGVGLLLAVVGVYGIMAYSVARQRAEIGVRMALGATRRDVMRLVMGRGLRLIAIGAVVGGVLALWATRFLTTQIWGISARDPLAYLAVALVLGCAGMLACLLPALRASHVSPIRALREEG
jgi:putative ABC transport system permease protein